MHRTAIKRLLCSDPELTMLQSFERGDAIDCENILLHDHASYFQLAALAMDFKRLDGINQLHALHAKFAYWGEYIMPKSMGEWFEPQDIAPFAAVFNVHQATHWMGVAERMVHEKHNAELEELLKLKAPSGELVVDPARSNSHLLWNASSKGNREAFQMLLPASRLSDDGYRCFIAAVYNNHYDIANDIINDCLSRNNLKGLMAGVQLFANEKFYDHNEPEDDKVREMVALIQRSKIASSVAPAYESRSRKM